MKLKESYRLPTRHLKKVKDLKIVTMTIKMSMLIRIAKYIIMRKELLYKITLELNVAPEEVPGPD